VAADRLLIARRIAEIRDGKKMSRRELGDRVDLTYLQVYRIEKGEVEISADKLAEIAEVLDASVASFYRESKAAS
jgi:transcriptional regulator with XRE-family HTH domain